MLPQSGDPASTTPATIFVSAVVFRDQRGRILTVRKRGTSRFMLIGGKPEAGESPRLAAVREVREEIGVQIDPGDLELLGMWRAAAANEAGHQVHGTVFVARQPMAALPAVRAEIAQARWLDPGFADSWKPGSAGHDQLAPLLSTRVLPALGVDPLSASQPWDVAHLPDARYGTTGPMGAQLQRAIRQGLKVATSSRLRDYHDEPLPLVGRMEVMRDDTGRALGLIETIAVQVLPISAISDDFARAEGEGFADYWQWRRAHEEFWGGPQADDELVVCEGIRWHPCPSINK